MYLMGLIILVVLIVPDATFGFHVGDFFVRAEFCEMFLCFIVLRRTFRYLVMMVFVYAMLARIFSGFGFSEVFVSTLAVYALFYKIRTEIYTESYIVQMFWVFVMVSVKALTMYVFDWSIWQTSTIMHQLGLIVANASFNCLLVIPYFTLLDRIYDMIGNSVMAKNKDGLGTVF